MAHVTMVGPASVVQVERGLLVTTSAAPNASFRAALEKVIDGERVVLATAVSRIRLVLGFCATLWAVRLLSKWQWQIFMPTIVVSVTYFVGALVVWRLLKTGKLVARAGWVVPLFDMPVIVIAQIFQTSRLPTPWVGLVNAPVMAVGFMVLTTLALSRSAIAVSALLGLVPIFYRAWYVRLPNEALVMVLLSFGVTAAVLMALVTRVRGLVHTSRAQDLLGKYVLGRRVGLGGMAEVFEATYSPEGGIERRVAVKRILPSFANQKDAIALFRQEAEVGAMLAHPGVVQVLDFGTHQGTAFLAMEFIDGVSLKDLIVHYRSMNKPMPIALVTHMAWQLTDALDYIHTRVSNTGQVLNLIHRDLNPPNIMLTRIGDTKLADFGIALVAGRERMTVAGIMRGKLAYAAPEQITGAAYDARADLFALGITLYECLVGQRLFRAENEMELMKQVLESEIAPPAEVRPDVPEALSVIVAGLLARDLAKRTPSADELRRQLLRLPRELVNVQSGRQLLSRAVASAKEALPGQLGPAVPITASSETAADAMPTKASMTSR